MIKDIIQQIYEEAISYQYDKTQYRTKAINNIVDFIDSGVVYDLCPQQQELCDSVDHVKPLIPDKDMHLYLEEIEPLNADMIVVRHVLEHSIMPYVLLRLLQKHTKKILLIVPENTRAMIEYDNHYSVMDAVQLTNLCKKSGWTITHLLTQKFQEVGSMEHVYLLTK